MKKFLFVLVLLGGAAGVAYSQGVFDPYLAKKDAPEGSTEAIAEAGDQDAAALFRAGKHAEAEAVLLERALRNPLSPENLHLLARIRDDAGNPDGAKEAWSSLLHDFPDDALCADARLGLAGLASRRGDDETAASLLRETWEKNPDSEAGRLAALKTAEIALASGDKDAARKAFSCAIRGAQGDQRERIKQALEELNRDFLYSGRAAEGMAVYTVQPGDSLNRIARHHGTTAGLIRKINRLEGDIIHPGQQLMILSGDVRIEVSKSLFTLTLFVEGIWMKEYLVGVGRDNKTPEGEFEIANRIENPPWFWKGEVIPAGDERNILGTRWMGFKNKPGLTGFGIHGTTEPESIPGAVSSGCVRMKNEEVEELFDLVPLGTKVIIRE